MIYDKIAKVSGRSVKRDKWLKAHNHFTKAGGIYEKGKEKAKSSFNSRGKDALIVSGKVFREHQESLSMEPGPYHDNICYNRKIPG